jgi:hypothetical protein
MLVLLMRRIYKVRRWDGIRLHGIHTKFYDDPSRHWSIIEVITLTIWEAAILVLLMRGIYEEQYLHPRTAKVTLWLLGYLKLFDNKPGTLSINIAHTVLKSINLNVFPAL